MDWLFGGLDGVITRTEKLATLSAAGVWAFFTLVLILYIVWDMRVKKSSSEQAWAAMVKDAETDGMVANAIEKLADQIKELRYKLKCIGGEDA